MILNPPEPSCFWGLEGGNGLEWAHSKNGPGPGAPVSPGGLSISAIIDHSFEYHDLSPES